MSAHIPMPLWYIYRCITSHYIALAYNTLHYITLAYNTLHYITLDYSTLHYVSW